MNTLFNALLHTPGFEPLDFSALRITLGGGMAVQAVVAARWKKVTGNVLTQAWGLTETSPAACINPIGLDFNGSIGLPIPSTDVSIRDDAGKELPVNEVGEICVFGPQVMRGYWNRPDETEKVMFGDWLRTGDIGRMDAKGFVYIEDRKKDMILVSGFNVYPNEVESVVPSIPGCSRSRRWRSRTRTRAKSVALFVVKKDPNLTAEALIAYCRTELDRLQGARSTCTSAPSCRRPTSARSCAARCATNCARRHRARRARARADPERATRAAARSVRPACSSRTVSTSTRHALRIDVGRDAVPQIEYVSRPCAEALEHAQGLGAQGIARARTARTDRDCPAAPRGPATARRASPVRGPVDARRASQPIAAISASHAPPPLVNTMLGTRRPSASRVSAATISRHVVQGELLRTAPGVSTPPQVSNSMTACAPAAICAFKYRIVASASTLEQPVQLARRLVHHALDEAEALAAAALHHVRRRPSRGCRRSRSAERGRRARGGPAPPRRSRT